ncbi:MAG TPA: FAD binding domain-containing protein, partial [Pseudolabrys sp.]|nr:FAD binding domain-containing protein [Pseudolabrys sp.]
MTPFDLSEPATLAEAVKLINPDDPGVRPIAGGTALMLMMKAGVFRPSRLISLRKLNDASTGIGMGPDGDLMIGAMTTLAALEHSAEVARAAPVIARIMPRLSNVRVRNVATVGGALAHGDPHMDLPPTLMALGARVRTVGANGGRELALEDLLTGYYETALAPDELIAS